MVRAILIKRGLPLWFLILSACGNTPAMKDFYVAPGVMQYYVPKTEWTVKGQKTVRAELDITCRNNMADPASTTGTFNISFFNTQKNPRQVSSAFFTHGGASYPLEDITTLYTKAKTKELRVTSKINREDMLAALGAESPVLVAVIDGAAYRFEPSKKFIALKDQLLEELTY